MIRNNWPAYNKDFTPTNTMGAVAEMFRTWRGTLRSNYSARSVAAHGKYADYLMKEHNLTNIFGEGSPGGKLYELDVYVFLIGVDFVEISKDFEIECIVQKATLGNGEVTFMKQRELEDFAVRWIEENRI